MSANTVFVGFLLASVLFVTRPAAPQDGTPATDETRKSDEAGNQASGRSDLTPDELQIQTNINRFKDAYNAHDASAIAELFSPDGRIIDKSGNQSQGRAAIAETFGEIFEAFPESRIDIEIESLEFLDPGLAVETGVTSELAAGSLTPSYDRYTVLHMKKDGQWLMAMARDEEGPPPTPHERLQPLAWLIGEWIDDDGRSVVASTCRWSDDGHFLLQEFQLKLSGEEAMNVSQRIGWDPVNDCIRSWTFDSEGGFGESTWTRVGDGWLIRAHGVLPGGSVASATNRLVQTGNDSYVWETSDRVVGGETQPSLAVKVVRKPPSPKK